MGKFPGTFGLLFLAFLNLAIVESAGNCRFRLLSVFRKENDHVQMKCYISPHTLLEGEVSGERCDVKCTCRNSKRYCCSDKLPNGNKCTEISERCLGVVLETGSSQKIYCRTSVGRNRRDIDEVDSLNDVV